MIHFCDQLRKNDVVDDNVRGGVVEDIVDTGHTLHHVLNLLKSRKPKRIEACALLDKPSRREVDVKSRWTGFEIPDEFVVGYGLDYAGRYRELPYLGTLKPEIYSHNT